MKVKIGTFDDKSFNRLIEIQLKKLADYKNKGYTKEQLYSKFTKAFIDKYF